MRATLFGIAAAAITAAVFATPASALPVPAGVDAAGTVEKTQIVTRRVVTTTRRPGPGFGYGFGPRPRACRTVVTTRVGPMGGRTQVRRQVCN